MVVNGVRSSWLAWATNPAHPPLGPSRGRLGSRDRANYDTLKAAALKAVPGGTVYRIETDVDGAAYEAHMTKADGSEVTVKFDENLAVTETQDGWARTSNPPVLRPWRAGAMASGVPGLSRRPS